MALRFLIVCESLVIANIIRRYIEADYGDARIDSADSPRRALGLLEERKYDLLFAASEMKEMGGVALRERMRQSDANSGIPAIIMTPTDSETQRSRLAEQGVRHVLPIPFRSAEFRHLLGEVLHGGAHTTSEARTRAFIEGDKGRISADPVHIGGDRVVCELESPMKAARLGSPFRIEIRFPADYGRAIVVHMIGDVRGADRERDSESRVALDVVWRTFELAAAAKKTLKMSLESGHGPSAAERLEALSRENEALSEENKKLKDSLAVAMSEKQELERRISRLEKALSQARKSAPLRTKDISLDSLINQMSERAKPPARLSIFKRVIEENVNIRDAKSDPRMDANDRIS